MENIIRLVDLTKTYDGVTVLNSINLSIKKNDFLTLLGPSGCGKTTTLRLVAGFEAATSGDVFFYDTNINSYPPYKRKVNTVFQKYALFPHMNVFENIAFGLRIKKVDDTTIKQKVSSMLELVNLPHYENRDIDSLSGGQQQRVAIARALVNEPEVLLLDEPLGALDLKLRKDMQTELKKIQQQLGITFIYVTHDQEEALTMSDTIVVMNGGHIQQTGTPIDIYNEPVNAFVADFIGESNIVEGMMVKDFVVDFAGYRFDCVDKGFGLNKPVDVVVRPEDVKLVSPEDGMLTGTVMSVVFKGVHYEMMIETKEYEFMVQSTLMEEVGTNVGIKILPNDIQIMHKPKNEFEEEMSYDDDIEEWEDA